MGSAPGFPLATEDHAARQDPWMFVARVLVGDKACAADPGREREPCAGRLK